MGNLAKSEVDNKILRLYQLVAQFGHDMSLAERTAIRQEVYDLMGVDVKAEAEEPVGVSG